jgi:hypothetical protein
MINISNYKKPKLLIKKVLIIFLINCSYHIPAKFRGKMKISGEDYHFLFVLFYPP